MSSLSNWKVSSLMQPKPADYGYDLDAALAAVVGVHAIIPSSAFTAETLGTERAGHGVFIRPGVVLTIGYLITEAEKIWLHLADGRAVEGHVLGYDQETGFGLVQVLTRIDTPVLPVGRSAAAAVGDRVVVAGAGGAQRSVAARISAKQEFAGYWEYLLEEAIFTTPAHPNWGGTAVIGADGKLIGIGSLQLQQDRDDGKEQHLNMVVPIDLLEPVIDDLLKFGRPNRPARPWLGLYGTQVEDKVVIVGLADRGPAQDAGLKTGDLVLEVAGTEIDDLADLFRAIWALGSAGVDVPLLVYRDGDTFDVRVKSGDRNTFLKSPSLH